MGSTVETNGGVKPKSSLTPFQKVLSYLAAPVFIVLGTILLLPGAEKEIDRAEMVYGITIAEAPSSVLNRGIIVIDRDENRIKCQLPTKAEVKKGAPMECTDLHGDQLLIKAKRPV